MKHDVKIVIGANYGDEGKGLMSRYFTKQFESDNKYSVTVLHNGTAQRGHTADYEDGSRHVFHNFGAGAQDGGATFYASTFLVHPMDFCREIRELGFVPEVYCDPSCIVVTPVDMLTDHILEDWIAVKTGAREYGSCCYGSWGATDRATNRPDLAFTVFDFLHGSYSQKMNQLHDWAFARLNRYGIDMRLIPQWAPYLDVRTDRWNGMCNHFKTDLAKFFDHANRQTFETIWNAFDSVIFEGAQGLLLDKDAPTTWTTTSNTGLRNPAYLLDGRNDFEAEVCYVTRSYVTRHGDGPLPWEVDPPELGDNIFDRTNVFNPFQGKLRYAVAEWSVIEDAVSRDMSKYVGGNTKFHETLAITHCNERDVSGGDYRSYSPCEVEAKKK